MTLHVDDPGVTADARKVEAEEPKPPSLGKRFFNFRTLLSFGLGFAILAFLFTRVQIDVGAILDWVRQANPWLLLAAFVAFYATFPVRARRWARLLREGGLMLRGRDLLEILMLGWFVNCLAPAKLGDLYRSYLVKQRFNVSLSRTVGVVVAERLLDIFVVFALLLVGGYIAFGRTVLPDLRLSL